MKRIGAVVKPRISQMQIYLQHFVVNDITQVGDKGAIMACLKSIGICNAHKILCTFIFYTKLSW